MCMYIHRWRVKREKNETQKSIIPGAKRQNRYRIKIGREKEKESSRNCTLIGSFDRFVMFCTECNRWTVIKTKISPCLLAFHAYHFHCVSEEGDSHRVWHLPLINHSNRSPVKKRHPRNKKEISRNICSSLLKRCNCFPFDEFINNAPWKSD